MTNKSKNKVKNEESKQIMKNSV